MEPKVLIGCPTYKNKEYCLKEYADAVNNLRYDNKDVLVVDNSEGDKYLGKLKQFQLNAVKDPLHFDSARDRIVHSRNIIRQKVLDESYDYFLSLEQDIIPHATIIEEMFDIISKNPQIKILTAVYFNNTIIDNKQIKVPLIYIDHPVHKGALWYISKKDLLQPKVMEIKGCGLGCIMIHRDVLKEVEFRWEGDSFDDMMFCKDAIEAGFKIYVHTGIIVKHLPSSWHGIKK